MSVLRRLFVLACALLIAAAGSSHAAPAAATQPVSFKRDVGPILLQQCQACHNAEKFKGKYRLDTFVNLTTPGAGKAPPVTAGQPTQSELLRRLTIADEDDRMPQKADPLPAAQVALIRRWIEEGAKFDGDDPRAALSSQVAVDDRPSAPVAYRRPVPITALAFSPDGQTLAAGGYYEVTLWDPASGKLLGRIPGVAQRVYGLDFSPDGRMLAVAGGTPGASGQVQLCALDKRRAGPPLDRIADCLLVARFSPDGARLAVGGADNAVRLYEPATGRRTQLIEQHADWVTDLAFSGDGRTLVTASRDKSARVFDVKTGAMRSAFLAHEQPVWAVAFDDKGKNVISIARDNRLRIWTASEAKEVGAIPAKDADVSRMIALGATLMTASADGMVREYSLEKKQPQRTFPGGHQPLYALAQNLKIHQLASGDHAGVVRVYDLERGVQLTEFIAAPGYTARE